MLKTALEKDPNYAEAYRLMGIAQLQMKKDKEADVYKRQGMSVSDVLKRDPGYYSWILNSDFTLNTKATLTKIRPVSYTHLLWMTLVHARNGTGCRSTTWSP